MTKKEKLINWARKKFKNDEEGKLLLLSYGVKYDKIRDINYLIKEAKIFSNINLLLAYLEKFSDELIELEYEEPPVSGNIYYSSFSEYDEVKEILWSEGIDIDDIGVSDYFWKSSEDIKYFEEE